MVDSSGGREVSAAARSDNMPSGIPFIVANEFAERFCYYGVNAILTIYMTQRLHFGDAKATEWQSLFKFAAYFFPLIGAILSDVFWGKYHTIMRLSLIYSAGCAIVSLLHTPAMLATGLGLMALGTGGIKPCVSANVGDQFTSANQHLIERAFSYFYISINAGSAISIYFCPVWLNAGGPTLAFGIPAIMMFFATVVFWMGRHRFVVVPPAMAKDAGRGITLFGLALFPVLGIAAWVFATVGPDYRTAAALLTLVVLLIAVVVAAMKTRLRNALPQGLRLWMEEAFTGDSLRQVMQLALIFYTVVPIYWSLWEQSNGQTWTLQATSDLMDKHLFGFLAGVPILGGLASYQILPAQILVANNVFILTLVPLFSFVIYPAMERVLTLTPLRKIGIGIWVISSSYLVVAMIENRIMQGQTVSAWWQIFAYMILTASEVLVSITTLEFSYMQAPLKLKSFIIALTYLVSQSVGNAFTAQVNSAMVKPLHAVEVVTGARTSVGFSHLPRLELGQKIDFAGDTGIQVEQRGGLTAPLDGTFLVAAIDSAHGRVEIMDAIHREPVASRGQFKPDSASVSTYKLVGPTYFLFFAGVGAAAAIGFIFVAGFYRERIHVRPAEAAA